MQAHIHLDETFSLSQLEVLKKGEEKKSPEDKEAAEELDVLE